MDREKVMRGLECCCTHIVGMSCGNCPYEIEQREDEGISDCTSELAYDALALLKEQEAVKPVLDETTKRFYRCGVCGEYVGYIDSDPGDPDEKDNYCRNCGRAVKWE